MPENHSRATYSHSSMSPYHSREEQQLVNLIFQLSGMLKTNIENGQRTNTTEVRGFVMKELYHCGFDVADFSGRYTLRGTYHHKEQKLVELAFDITTSLYRAIFAEPTEITDSANVIEFVRTRLRDAGFHTIPSGLSPGLLIPGE